MDFKKMEEMMDKLAFEKFKEILKMESDEIEELINSPKSYSPYIAYWFFNSSWGLYINLFNDDIDEDTFLERQTGLILVVLKMIEDLQALIPKEMTKGAPNEK